jgi:hypothetical protein
MVVAAPVIPGVIIDTPWLGPAGASGAVVAGAARASVLLFNLLEQSP